MTDLELQMYGCDPEIFVESMKSSPTFDITGKDGVIISLLSDVQELVSLNLAEKARQMLNLVKYIVATV